MTLTRRRGNQKKNFHQMQWLSILFDWQRGAKLQSFPNGIWEREKSFDALGSKKSLGT